MAEATHASPLPLQRRGLRQAKAHDCHERDNRQWRVTTPLHVRRVVAAESFCAPCHTGSTMPGELRLLSEWRL